MQVIAELRFCQIYESVKGLGTAFRLTWVQMQTQHYAWALCDYNNDFVSFSIEQPFATICDLLLNLGHLIAYIGKIWVPG